MLLKAFVSLGNVKYDHHLYFMYEAMFQVKVFNSNCSYAVQKVQIGSLNGYIGEVEMVQCEYHTIPNHHCHYYYYYILYVIALKGVYSISSP